MQLTDVNESIFDDVFLQPRQCLDKKSTHFNLGKTTQFITCNGVVRKMKGLTVVS